jgi:hypothetical protein
MLRQRILAQALPGPQEFNVFGEKYFLPFAHILILLKSQQ